MPVHTSIRPVTSKARGICKYYTTPRGCFAGESCKFLHQQPDGETKEGEQPPLTPYDKSKRCKYFDQGFCKRGENCWFLHKSDRPKDIQSEEEHEACSICFETPAIYGLLGGCSHIFCITCIRQWRDPQNKSGDVVESGNTKKCPMCRASSRFITPSSMFWKDGTEEKKIITQTYMESMERVPCRYFQKSLAKNPGRPTCPYGKDCFYLHLKEDGTPFVFEDGVDVCMRKYGRRSRRDIVWDFLPIDIRIAADAFFSPFYDPGPRQHTDPTMAPIPSTSGLHTDATPSIHHQHNRERNYYNRDGIAIAVRRLREVGRSLEILNDATSETFGLAVEAFRADLEGAGETVDWVDSVQQGNLSDRDGDEVQEDEVMERLERLADRVLASGARQPGAGAAETSATHTESRQALRNSTLSSDDNPLPRLIHYLSMFDDDGGDDDDEGANDMPALQSVSSDTDGSEDEDTDLDVDEEIVDASDDVESASVSVNPSEEPLASIWLSTVGQLEDDASAASPGQMGDEAVDRSDVPDLEDTPPSSVTQTTAITTTTRNITPPTTRGSKNGRPSDAFTTDGRGRVISVGDTPPVVPPLSQSGDEVQPESSAIPTTADTGRAETRRGILGWLGSLV